MLGSPVFEGVKALWSNPRKAREPLIHLGLSHAAMQIAALFFFVCGCITSTTNLAGKWSCTEDKEGVRSWVMVWCEAQKKTHPIGTMSDPNFHDTTFMMVKWASLNLFFMAFSFAATSSLWYYLEGDKLQ